MADIALVTANLGNHDRIFPQAEQTVPVDWLYFTDAPIILPPPWTTVEVPYIEGDQRLLAKRYRMPPFAEGILGEYRWVIWIDAAAEITSPNFIDEAITAAAAWIPTPLGDGTPPPLMAWKHPRRDCIYDEAVMSLQEAPDKYGPEILAQAQAYKVEGYPEHNGLYATGTLVWNMDPHRPTVGGKYATAVSTGEAARTLGEAWLREIEATTVQDQLSLPVVAWRLGIEIATFPYPQVLSPRLTHRSVVPPGWKPPPRRHDDGSVYRVARNRWMIFHPHTRRD